MEATPLAKRTAFFGEVLSIFADAGFSIFDNWGQDAQEPEQQKVQSLEQGQKEPPAIPDLKLMLGLRLGRLHIQSANSQQPFPTFIHIEARGCHGDDFDVSNGQSHKEASPPPFKPYSTGGFHNV